MKLPFTTPSNPTANSPLQQELDRLVLRGERTRAIILAASMAFVLVGMLTLRLTIPGITQRMFGWNMSVTVIGTIMLSGVLAEIKLWWILTICARRGKHPPVFVRYLSAFIEISIPTLIGLYVGSLGHPLMALLGPPVLIYFLLIMLSTLRLNFRISVFTGVVAAAQYAILAHRAIADSRTAAMLIDPLLVSPLHHAGKMSMIIAGGIVAGSVTRQILSHVGAAVQTVQERDRVVELFGRHVSPAVVDKLLAQPNLEGEVRSVCVMFFDIRNFTTFSEGRPPEEVVRFLNLLFAPLIDCVNRHQGIINKFLGDGFMAVFGAPLPDGQAACNAVRAAREMLAAVTSLQEKGVIPPTRIGIGLHVGDAVTGIVGSAERKEYTIIGDVVNLAARIEGLNKQFDSQLLVSAAVREQALEELPDATSRGTVHVKGREGAVEIFQAA